jgi:hypothetical protein
LYTYIPLTLYLRRGSRGISDIPPRLPRFTADVTSGKTITVWSQYISGAKAINPLVALYDIHGRKREALFFYFVPDTRHICIIKIKHSYETVKWVICINACPTRSNCLKIEITIYLRLMWRDNHSSLPSSCWTVLPFNWICLFC